MRVYVCVFARDGDGERLNDRNTDTVYLFMHSGTEFWVLTRNYRMHVSLLYAPRSFFSQWIRCGLKICVTLSVHYSMINLPLFFFMFLPRSFLCFMLISLSMQPLGVKTYSVILFATYQQTETESVERWMHEEKKQQSGMLLCEKKLTNTFTNGYNSHCMEFSWNKLWWHLIFHGRFIAEEKRMRTSHTYTNTPF